MKEVKNVNLLSKTFADMMQPFMCANKETKEIVLNMVKIVHSESSTEDEKNSAIETIAMALFY